ncbi:MAG TPA: heavy metal translocating P-type ATPase [Actinomycetota bacterium]|nr:heavy metal translocating P-type ATPase [Actinomycetota bacterium]
MPLAISLGRALLKRELGVDLIAVVAMLGALLTHEDLAGAVVAFMLSGGLALEEAASRRARRELSGLLQRAPTTVRRYEGDDLVPRPAAEVSAGDRLLVRSGEVVPVDGTVRGSMAVIDESALTGEARPVEYAAGADVRSGTVNAGPPFDLVATARAQDSTYAGVVRLVEQAESGKAPFVRLADRYAAFFVPLALAGAGVAWLVTGQAVRGLAVLVVATPCPLILAAPIAFVAGMSRAAHRGIIVKNSAALEGLDRVQRLLIDKTGTVTAGTPMVSALLQAGDAPAGHLLALAASLEQASAHVFGEAIVAAARAQGVPLAVPEACREIPGQGLLGVVGGEPVRLGSARLVFPEGIPDALLNLHRTVSQEGQSEVFVATGGSSALLVLEDPLRPDAAATIRALRQAGIRNVTILSGDALEISQRVGLAVGADDVRAGCSPQDKLDVVVAAREQSPVVMVGDGLNDAAALAAADVGIAMGARGAAAQSEAADVVIMVDRLSRVVEAIGIARRSCRIARQSVQVGMGLSLVAMAVAAAGYLAPVWGALLQEAIDVAVILNALRALTPGRRRPAAPGATAVAEQARQQHRVLAPHLGELSSVADRLDAEPPREALAELVALRRFLLEEIAPHERQDDRVLYPVVAGILGGSDPTGAMSRGHVEIARLIAEFDRRVSQLGEAGPTAEDLPDLRRLLYGLAAVLRLHFAQEDESFLSLTDLEGEVPAAPSELPPAS